MTASRENCPSSLPTREIVHIDIDPTTLRKNVRVEVPVVSDALSALQGLRSILESGHAQKDWAGDRMRTGWGRCWNGRR